MEDVIKLAEEWNQREEFLRFRIEGRNVNLYYTNSLWGYDKLWITFREGFVHVKTEMVISSPGLLEMLGKMMRAYVKKS